MERVLVSSRDDDNNRKRELGGSVPRKARNFEGTMQRLQLGFSTSTSPLLLLKTKHSSDVAFANQGHCTIPLCSWRLRTTSTLFKRRTVLRCMGLQSIKKYSSFENDALRLR